MINKVMMVRRAVKISARGRGEVNAAKKKHLVAGFANNTRCTVRRDRLMAGREGSRF